MSVNLDLLREQKILRALEALQRARSLRHSRGTAGVDGICQHIEDVDGDWLENWTDTEDTLVNDEIDKDDLTL